MKHKKLKNAEIAKNCGFVIGENNEIFIKTASNELVNVDKKISSFANALGEYFAKIAHDIGDEHGKYFYTDKAEVAGQIEDAIRFYLGEIK